MSLDGVRIDLSWLDEPFRPGELSRLAQQGVVFALNLRDTPGLTVAKLVATLPDDGDWHERKARRRVARARMEILNIRRCKCGCGERLPRWATSRRAYLNDTHKKRGARGSARVAPQEPADVATRRLQEWQRAVRSSA